MGFDPDLETVLFPGRLILGGFLGVKEIAENIS